ncbi:MAG: hypothetical protein R3Y21_04515 [Mycoplasmatota bacterium]
MAKFNYKNIINNNYQVNICVEVVYNREGHPNYKKESSDHYDSGSFRMKCEEVCKDYTSKVEEEYESKCKGVGFLAVAKYLFDNLPEIEHVEFISSKGNSIYSYEDIQYY